MLFYFIFDHRHTSLFIHQSLMVSHVYCTVYYAEVKGQFWPRPELIIYLSIYLSISIYIYIYMYIYIIIYILLLYYYYCTILLLYNYCNNNIRRIMVDVFLHYTLSDDGHSLLLYKHKHKLQEPITWEGKQMIKICNMEKLYQTNSYYKAL